MESSIFSLLFPFSWVADWNLGVAPRMTGVASGAGVGKSSFSFVFPFSWVANWNLDVAPRRTGAVLGAGADKGAETSKGSFSDSWADWASDSWAAN